MSLRKYKRQKAREEARQVKYWEDAGYNARRAALMQNGITPEYLQEREKAAENSGFEEGRVKTIHTSMAAMCLGANKAFGFGADRCFKLMRAAMEYMQLFIDEQDAIDQVYEATGLQLEIDDITKAVRRLDKGKKKIGRLRKEVEKHG